MKVSRDILRCLVHYSVGTVKLQLLEKKAAKICVTEWREEWRGAFVYPYFVIYGLIRVNLLFYS